MTESPIHSVYVGARTLRQRFAELEILEQLDRGEILVEVDREWNAPSSSGQPPGTKGQRVFYFRGEQLIAVVHQYLRPDGTLGASGLPDPKWLRDGNTILKFKPS